MKKIQTRKSDWDTEIKKNTWREIYWGVAWILSLILMIIGSKHIWNFNILLTLFACIINVAIGIGMIRTCIQSVKGQDEMQQKIILEATAITLGATVVFAGSYQLWEDIKLITFVPQVWHVVGGMGLTFMLSLTALTRMYK